MTKCFRARVVKTTVSTLKHYTIKKVKEIAQGIANISPKKTPKAFDIQRES